MFKPACYQDLLDGKPLFHRVSRGRSNEAFLEIVPGQGRLCPSNMAGPSFLLGWQWKGINVGGSQGHLPIETYETESAYQMARQSNPVLYVEAAPCNPYP